MKHIKAASDFLAAALILTGSIRPAAAADRYLIRFDLQAGRDPSGCCLIHWFDQVTFHNSTSAAVVVTVLGLSNGSLPDGAPTTFQIAAGSTATLRYQDWEPYGAHGAFQGIYVAHLDVPAGVIVDSRGVWGATTLFTQAALDFPTYGKFALPIFSALTPAGVAQYHMSTELGGVPSHENVGVYNAGATAAQAHIELRQGCDDTLLGSLEITIPPNTAVQLTGPSADGKTCPPPDSDYLPQPYIVVTVDQPSLSWVTTVANGVPQPISVNVSQSR
jgi:hypothetical protein